VEEHEVHTTFWLENIKKRDTENLRHKFKESKSYESKVIPIHMHLTRKATHRRHIHKATCILYIRTRWREVVIFMPLPFKPQEKRPGTK
jgi:hypothetical protein